MTVSVELRIDVTEAAGLGEPAHVAMTVVLPDPDRLTKPPIVCFAKPGGGYSRAYFTIDLPGPGQGSQADWHTERGWIFVAVDHLGVGDSSVHAAGALDFPTVAAGSHAAEMECLRLLAAGEIGKDFPPVRDPVTIGIGQSMGGCMTIVQQGHYHDYDGIGVLGYSAIHTHPPMEPGREPLVAPWIPRDGSGARQVITNRAAYETHAALDVRANAMAWGFHYADVDAALVEADLARFDHRLTDVEHGTATSAPPWGSLTFPIPVAPLTLTPGVVASEAAAVAVPVLCSMGERDVIADPPGEPRAFRSAPSVDLYVCPRMGHMHNFAGTRELFWERIDTWAQWVCAWRASA